MSDFDATGATQGFQFTFNPPVDDLTFQTEVTATATQYAWTSADGHLVTATGSFVGASGTVTAVTIDLGDNGSDDILITAVPNASLANMLLDFSNLWSELFGSVDMFDLTGTVSMDYMGDFFNGTGATGGGDSFVGTPDGKVTLYGDHWGPVGVSGGGNDIFDVTLSAGTDTAAFNGDTDTLGSGDVFTGGYDVFSITRSVARTVTVRGDAVQVFGGTLYGGDDTMSQDGSANDLLTTFYGDTAAIASGGLVVGGDDSVTGSGKLYGDAFSIATGSDLTGGNDTLTGLGNNDLLYGDVETIRNIADAAAGFVGGNDTLTGNAGNDQLWGDIEWLEAGATIMITEIQFGADMLFGGAGNDQLWGDWDLDEVGILADAGGNDALYGGNGNDDIRANGGHDTAEGGVGNDTLYGGSGNDILRGQGNADVLYGAAGNDTLEGGNSDDLLDGGADNDSLTGGAGADRYFVTAGDLITETAGGGIDALYSNDSFVLAADDDIETMGAVDEAALTVVSLTGNALAQTIAGGAGGDTLSDGGGAGADTLTGNAGNDTYIIRTAATLVIESAGTGTADKVAAGVSFVLAADDDIELMNTTSLAGTGAINLTGNALAQTITGNAGVNTLTDAAGAADTLAGSLGNDTYVVRALGTQINESLGGGTADKVAAAVSFVLAADDDIEIMTTTSLAGLTLIDLTGNALSQTITGNAAANILTDASGAADTLAGSLGDDTYIVRALGTLINEVAGNGTADKVAAAVSFVLAADDDIEIMSTTSAAGLTLIDLTGNALSQTITGNAAANILTDGAGAADTLAGSFGDDTYILRTAGTRINEEAGTGTADKAAVAVSFVLAADDDIEIMTTTSLAGVGTIDLTGNRGAQQITGNAGNNRIDGAGGSDTLTGHLGQDVFVFNAPQDGFNIKTITDYTVADDAIELNDTFFAALAPGVLAGTAFVANTTGLASTVDHRIIYDTDDGLLWYDEDGTGAVAAVQVATLDASLALVATEFTVT